MAWQGRGWGGLVAWPQGARVQCAWGSFGAGLGAERGGEFRLLLVDEGSPSFLFSGAVGGLAADGRLVPCVGWSWRMRLDGGGQVGRGHSMVVTATGWGASLQPHHLSLLAHSHCCRDGAVGWRGIQHVQRARLCASFCVYASACCLEGQPSGNGARTYLHCVGYGAPRCGC